ncbi:MAG: hypothetical protein IJS48_06130 [Prevotella sp.]|nr:hypothetical protein [Prevotella sp.]
MKDMKRYIKPTIEEMGVDMLSLLRSSIKTVDGVDITVSGDEFEGGNADSRSERIWGDDELE